ncbi:acryloyl-CoA reductase [Rhodohalobacter sp. SW132]|uniref:YhdH/YhfP family quinone oxidoreductase n=1 Tax=Rhodohalobacter sp. SW132 TaxID=2293433 RepID=UPI000E22E79D|nr:YhdH/YhfP family quinone oxidoreductase [Rhodohalobacter sp. SW132]REL38805.1 acryloyl-CoA reductase [Rhodohalobacter sp. SW132]
MKRPDIAYRALVADKPENGEMKLSVQELNTQNLPAHDVLVNVHYSSLNYKDALSASGNPGVTKAYPHTPGIDAAGVVKWSKDSRFSEGDKVIVTSYDLGQNTPGGFGEYISVPGDWIVPLSEGLTLKESMILGTAGFTAAYGVEKLADQNLQPDSGKILVTGATGGVGSLAVAILSHLGYSVIAVTGKKEKHPFLKMLGADRVLGREEITGVGNSPMLSARWAGAIDTVGGEMLDAIIRQTAHNGTVACCGNILGGELNTSIYPFILRGVALMGVDSGICLMKDRVRIWDRLSGSWKPDKALLHNLSKICRIEELPAEIEKILNGNQSGRVVLILRD